MYYFSKKDNTQTENNPNNNHPTTTKLIEISSPIVGEKLELGATKKITWEYSPEFIESIKSNSNLAFEIHLISNSHGGQIFGDPDNSETNGGKIMQPEEISEMTSLEWKVGALSYLGCPPGGLCPTDRIAEWQNILPGKYKIVIGINNENWESDEFEITD